MIDISFDEGIFLACGMITAYLAYLGGARWYWAIFAGLLSLTFIAVFGGASMRHFEFSSAQASWFGVGAWVLVGFLISKKTNLS